MDKETREFLDKKFDAIDEKFSGVDENFSRIHDRFSGVDGKFEETQRHFGVIAEDLRIEIRQVAEGHGVIRTEIQAFRNEVSEEFKEVKSMIKFSYAELDQRIRMLETEFQTIKTRMDRLEAQKN